MSKGEEKIYKILNKYRGGSLIRDIRREFIFKGLNYKGSPLRFDFAVWRADIPTQMFLVEYDGQQHFEYNKFFHKKYSTFRHMQANDRRKNEYALKNNIPLYRIPYWDIDSINSLLDILRPQYRVKSKYHNDDLALKHKQR